MVNVLYSFLFSCVSGPAKEFFNSGIFKRKKSRPGDLKHFSLLYIAETNSKRQQSIFFVLQKKYLKCVRFIKNPGIAGRLLLLLACSFAGLKSFSQGCSDAGLCSFGSLNVIGFK